MELSERLRSATHKLPAQTRSSGVLKRGQESNFQFTVKWEMWSSLESLKHPSPSRCTQWVERWAIYEYVCLRVSMCVHVTCLRSVSGKCVIGGLKNKTKKTLMPHT